jgi:putative Mg2+ transporter-C (MgtC) family protein
MDLLWNELTAGVADAEQAIRVLIRVLGATLLGAVIGYERERTGKSAGLRTHMLVSLGSALFVLAPMSVGMTTGDASRIVQGVAAGIGFLGAGAILKRDDEKEIHGLTTAAGIWMTAAAGVATGMGAFGVAAICVVLGWIILAVLARFETPRRT